MNNFAFRLLTGLSFVLLGSAAVAQTFTYDILLDADLNQVTGCTVSAPGGATVSGSEQRLRAVVDSASLMITDVSVASCDGAVFGPDNMVDSGIPVGLDIGIGGSDVLEFSAAVSALQASGLFAVRVLAQDGSGSDVLSTTDGSAGGQVIIFGIPVEVPTLGWIGLLILAGSLVVIALLYRRRLGGHWMIVSLLGVSGIVLAANFISDGMIDDWSGSIPQATDATGDSTNGSDGNDIVALFIALENDTLFFRVDAVDLENQAPVAADDAFATDEDVMLSVAAPGVLANDTDANMDPLTANLVTDVSNGSLTLNADGSFDYTPNADFSGTDSFTYSANDGFIDSVPATVTITVNPVNDAPEFTVTGPATVLEDSGAAMLAGIITMISPGGGADEASQMLTFNINSNDNMGLFDVQPSIAADGTISFTPAADEFGTANLMIELMDDGGIANGGVDTSAPQALVITVDPVNDQPDFTGGPDQTVLEDAGPQTAAGWATAISAGAANESGQMLTFNVTANDNMALFSAQPAVDPGTGDLTFTPADDANGTANITIELMDDGGTANGGVDTSAPFSFVIDVTPVNDAPEFTLGGDQTVLEDAGPQTVGGFATGISAGPADESSQMLTFTIVGNDNPALFSAGPALDATTGDLTFTPAADASGTANITIELMDNGGTANGGVDTSATMMFAITVTPVNDQPSLVIAGNQMADEDAGPQMAAGFAVAAPGGGADEAGQTFTFNVSNDSNALFSAQPAIDPAGQLTYTSETDANGSATVTVTVTDSGGTANGGVDTSAPPMMFTITINPINDPPTASGTPTAQNVLGNVMISVPVAEGLISSATITDPDGPGAEPFNVSGGPGAGVTSFMSANGGDVVITDTATGTYTYNPAPGFEGADSFTYVVCDSGVPLPSECSTPIMVDLTVTGMIWFVDENAAAGGDGRLTAPFDDFGVGADSFDINAADDSGDVIFIDSGTYQGGVTLLDDQRIIGAGAIGTLAGNAGVTVPPNSAALPTTPAVRPAISSVGTNVLDLGMNNILRGFNVGNASGSIGIAGNNFGSLAISQMIILGLGQSLDLDTGTVDATIDQISSTNSTGEGVSLGNVAGTFTVTGPTTVTNPAAIGINIVNSSTSYTFGDVTVNSRNSAGVFINANTGGVQNGQFGTVTINNQNGSATTAFGIDNAVTGGSSITVTSVAIDNNGAASSAIALSNNDGANINIQGGSVQNAAGAAVSISSSSGTATYAGTINNTAGRSLQVLLNNGAGAETTVSGNITDSGTGIFLDNNPGGTINLPGVLDLDTTTNTAFNATGGGTVNAGNAGNTINNSTGIGVNITGTSIGGAGVTFRSINVNGASSGIILNGTGDGSFTVTGDGSNARNGSGGTIQNTTSDGVMLTNASNVRMQSVNLINTGDTADSMNQNNRAANDHAIDSSGGGNIVLSGVQITNPAASGWEAENLTGTNRIDNDSLIEDINVSNFQAVNVRNTDVNLAGLTIDDSTFRDQTSTNGSTFVLFESFGSSNMTVNVQNDSLFTNLFGVALQFNSNGSGLFTADVMDSSFTNAVEGMVGVGASGGIGGVVFAASGDGDIDFLLDSNMFMELGRPLVAGGLVTVQAIGGTGKQIDGVISNNTFDRIGFPNSTATTTGVGHRVIDVVTENTITGLNVEILNNVMTEISNTGLFISARDNGNDFDVRVDGNSITNAGAGGSSNNTTTNQEAFEVLSEDASDMQIIVNNNTFAGNTNNLDEVVGVDVENTSLMNMTFTSNTVSNSQANMPAEIVIDTENMNPNGLCLEFTGNTAPDVELDVDGTFQVEDFANLSANNNGITIIDGAGVTDVAVGACTEPDF